jgi:hypothetical protein
MAGVKQNSRKIATRILKVNAAFSSGPMERCNPYQALLWAFAQRIYNV